MHASASASMLHHKLVPATYRVAWYLLTSWKVGERRSLLSATSRSEHSPKIFFAKDITSSFWQSHPLSPLEISLPGSLMLKEPSMPRPTAARKIGWLWT